MLNSQDRNNEIAVLGGGCFWCTEAIYRRLRGVECVTSGYAGGLVANPTYEQVSNGDTGYAEAIQIEFDPGQISFSDLLNVFFATHEPTTLNRQGADAGTQYRSVIFYTTPVQRDESMAFIKKLKEDEVFSDPIITEVSPLNKFYQAENYHQRYYESNRSKPYCQVVIDPKIAKLKQKFSALLKENNYG